MQRRTRTEWELSIQEPAKSFRLKIGHCIINECYSYQQQKHEETTDSKNNKTRG